MKNNDIKENDWHNITLDGSRARACHKDSYMNSYKVKHYRNQDGRLVNSREYAIAWGVLNKPYSCKDLMIKCRQPDAPSYQYICKKEWKGYPFYYRDLVRHGMEPRPPRTDMEKRKIIHATTGNILRRVLLTEDYNLAKFAASIGVTSKKTYDEHRKNSANKQFMPCYETVVRRFGTWRLFMNEVMKYNVDIIMTRYVEGSIAAGHWLKLSECDKLKIPLRKAMDVLRPRFFNALCYRKKELMDNKGVLPKHGEVKDEKRKGSKKTT